MNEWTAVYFFLVLLSATLSWALHFVIGICLLDGVNVCCLCYSVDLYLRLFVVHFLAYLINFVCIVRCDMMMNSSELYVNLLKWLRSSVDLISTPPGKHSQRTVLPLKNKKNWLRERRLKSKLWPFLTSICKESQSWVISLPTFLCKIYFVFESMYRFQRLMILGNKDIQKPANVKITLCPCLFIFMF